MKKNKILKYILYICTAAIFMYIVYFLSYNSPWEKTEHLSLTKLLTKVVSGKIDNIHINNTKCTGNYKTGEAFDCSVPTSYKFLQLLLSNGVEVFLTSNSDSFIIPIVLQIISFFIQVMIIRMIFGGMSDSFSSNKIGEKEEKILKFKDVAGMHSEKQELQEVIDSMNNSDSYLKLGCRPPRGIVLFGPPGNGKTLIAKALAGESKADFFFASGAEFVQIFVGTGPARIRDLFKMARKSKKALIFIDEADSLGNRSTHKSYGGGGSGEYVNTINALLKEMDGSDNILVVFATNFLEDIDPALLRSGRIDREIKIGNPDRKERALVLEYYLLKGDLAAGSTGIKISRDVDVNQISRLLSGFSRADIEALVNEARFFAVRDKASFLSMKHFDKARDRVILGMEGKKDIIPYEETRNTSYHEAGHAFLMYIFRNELRADLYKATIIPRGNTLGVAMLEPQEKFSEHKEELEAHIMVCLAGRISEHIFFGNKNVTSGCSSDLRAARNIAEHYVIMGMDDEYGLSFITRDVRIMSENEKSKIHESIKNLLDRFTKKTFEIMEENKEIIRTLAKTLLEKETLTGTEIAAIIEGKGFVPVLYKKNRFFWYS